MVDPELFERYRQALGTNADLTKRAVEELLSRLDGLTPLEQAEYLMANYPKLVKAYGRVAADVARQYYQEQRDGSDLDTDYVAQSAQPIPEQWLQEDVSDAFTGNHGMTVAKLPGKASKRAMQRADETIGYNARRDKAHSWWAIVPNPGACAFCVMVGSRGFVYHTNNTADAQRHSNCKCVVVCDFDTENPALDGYDPGKLYDQYLGDLAEGIVTTHGSSIGSIGLKSAAQGGTQTVDALPSRSNWSGKWAKAQMATNMPTMQHYLAGSQSSDELKGRMDECNDFLAKSGMDKAMSKGQWQQLQASLTASKESIEQRGKAFSAIDADRSVDDHEKSRRKARYVSINEERLLFVDANGNRSIPIDPGSGTREPDYCCMTGKQRRSLKDYEVSGHEVLARLGFDTIPLPTEHDLPSGFANIDLWMDGQFWELKTPQGAGSSLTKRINDGISKWDRMHSFGLADGDTPRIVVDNRFSTMSDSDALLKLKTAMAVNEAKGFNDAVFISSVGAVTRLSA
ncbi:MAG: hypothetical protein IKG69_12210 [Atopobiaceae bacterium]|nr:hypothetical protein [Atopobiaceae bacterium]